MAMQLKGELRDLLMESYSRLNDLNGLFRKRDLMDDLMKNSFKCKLKAKDLFYRLHHFLDTSYAQLLKSIDSTVSEITNTLNEHSSEIDNCVNYMAQICLIAEKFLNNSSLASHNADGSEIINKLSETLIDSDVLKTVDYNACVSLDLDVDLKSLFEVPFIHVGSHRSDQSGFSKLYSLKLDDLKVPKNLSAQNVDVRHLNSSNEVSSGSKDPFKKLSSQKEHEFSAHEIPGFKDEEQACSKFSTNIQSEVSTGIIERHDHGEFQTKEKDVPATVMCETLGKGERYVYKYTGPGKDLEPNTQMANISDNLYKDGPDKIKQNLVIHVTGFDSLTETGDNANKQFSGNHSHLSKMKTLGKEQTPMNLQTQMNVGRSKPLTFSKCAPENVFESMCHKETSFMAPSTLKGQDFDKSFSMTYNDHQTHTCCSQNRLDLCGHMNSTQPGCTNDKILSFNSVPDRQT